jgi:muramoyltetrapeptide carboxypeptidase
VRFPPLLRPGDTVAVIAPSSPFDPTLAWRGLGWLATRFRLRFSRSLFERHGYLAGRDERRLGEIEGHLRDPAVRALVAVRGGYGLSRIAHLVDWSLLDQDPRWIVGFSDLTALHVEAARLGIASIHGPMVAALGRGDAVTRGQVERCLCAPLAPHAIRLEGWTPGRAEGPLFGGNLTLLQACAAAGRLRVPEGAILLLEDVTERPYRIDRALSSLIAGGHLRSVAGVVVGQFTDCGPGPDGVLVEEVLRERLGSLGVPVAAGAAIGHGYPNEPVVLGRRYALDAAGGEAHAVDDSDEGLR